MVFRTGGRPVPDPVTPDDTVATLRGQVRERRARDAARAAEVRRIVLDVVGSRLPKSGRVWLIGTLAWGGFGARSDVDLVVDQITDAQATEIETEITRTARIEVDVLQLADLPETFRARVFREGLAIHGG